MPRSRGSDVPQRLTPRASLHLKVTALSEVNGAHRPVVVVDRSPKLDERRSPRSPLHEKKRGTRVADLETKLGKAQEELQKLRDQLASAEAAKLDAEQALVKAKEQIPNLTATPKKIEEKPLLPKDSVETSEQQQPPEPEEESIRSPVTTDVIEVLAPNDQTMNKENEDESSQNEEEEETVAEKEVEETKSVIVKDKVDDANYTITVKREENEEKQEKAEEELELKELPESPEMVELNAKLVEEELEILLEENAILKTKAKEEAESIAAAARAKEEELVATLRAMEKELKESRSKVERLEDQLDEAEQAKATIEVDIKRLKVQNEQWRKAAEAAAAMIATGDRRGMEIGGRKVAEQCGSMEKHLAGGYVGWGSLLTAGDPEEDGMTMGGGRRKGAGIRMFGDLWKKKGQQK